MAEIHFKDILFSGGTLYYTEAETSAQGKFEGFFEGKQPIAICVKPNNEGKSLFMALTSIVPGDPRTQRLTYDEAVKHCKACKAGDWRLPTAKELKDLCEDRNRVCSLNKVLTQIGTPFMLLEYWSSTEQDAQHVSTVDTESNTEASQPKNGLFYARAFVEL